MGSRLSPGAGSSTSHIGSSDSGSGSTRSSPSRLSLVARLGKCHAKCVLETNYKRETILELLVVHQNQYL